MTDWTIFNADDIQEGDVFRLQLTDDSLGAARVALDVVEGMDIDGDASVRVQWKFAGDSPTGLRSARTARFSS
jgi:hypothetical protein